MIWCHETEASSRSCYKLSSTFSRHLPVDRRSVLVESCFVHSDTESVVRVRHVEDMDVRNPKLANGLVVLKQQVLLQVWPDDMMLLLWFARHWQSAFPTLPYTHSITIHILMPDLQQDLLVAGDPFF